MWNLIVFAAIGLIVGAAARLAYPNRQGTHIFGTMLLGAVGALAGGMLSWIYWPDVDGQFQTGNLVMSAIGAVVAIQIWAAVSYARRIGGRQGVA
jgi:uncharacterized membrane protein YeaQ/YmgE (transglycosylase-associated protein family)